MKRVAMSIVFLATLVDQVGLSLGIAEDEPSVRYKVTFENVANHYVGIEATFTASEPEQELFLPVWTPGSYLVREYARHIDSVSAKDLNGNEIDISKISKNRWKLSNQEPLAFTVDYRVYCNELSVRTNFADSEFALLNAAATFLTTEQAMESEQVVQVELPDRWHQAVTSLERRVALGPHTFAAKNYDELVDSPFVIGNPTLHPFEVGGVTHYLVNQGGDGLWNGERAAADLAKIVLQHQETWGTVPYAGYYFLNVIAESGGGLEHDNSTVMLTSRWSFRDPKRYERWLGLASHEFFHTWNVRRLRPKALVEYDYETENYFQELWVAEGVTSYYDSLALARTGLTKPKDYLAELSKQINTLQTTDGRSKQSLADASHDAWIKFYRPNENSRNTSINYYNKGSVVAFLLDIEIRRATNDEKCLDDVMRGLYEKYALGEGYTTEEVIAEVNAVTGSDWTEWFDNAIYSSGELDYAPALDWLGLQFAHESKPSEVAEGTERAGESDGQSADAAPANDDDSARAKDLDKSGEPAAESDDNQSGDNDSEKGSKGDSDQSGANDGDVPNTQTAKAPIWTGLSTSGEDGKLNVSAVSESSPAFRAGVNVGDEIIAVNDYRISNNLSDLLKQFEADGEVELLYSRRGALHRTQLSLQTRPVTEWKLTKLRKPTDRQRQALATWLHQELETATDAK